MIDQERKDIWNGLRRHRGAIQELVDSSDSIKKGGYSRFYIYQVLSGSRSNVEILLLAASVLARREKAYKETISRIKSTAKSLQVVMA